MSDSDEQLRLLVIEARQELPDRMVAFERLSVLIYASVRNLAHGITGSADLAQSVAQDVLLRVMHGLPRLEEPERFFGWVRTITVNVSNTRVAKENREREKIERFRDEDPEPEPAEALEEIDSFDEMVRGLAANDRAIVCLKILDDLEFQEIADITGLSVSAAKMRYYRALERVKAQLGDQT